MTMHNSISYQVDEYLEELFLPERECHWANQQSGKVPISHLVGRLCNAQPTNMYCPRFSSLLLMRRSWCCMERI